MAIAILIIVAFVFAIFIYVIVLLWDARHSVESMPRADMFVCDRHGAVPMKYTVQLDMAGITEAPIPFCPFCYDEKMKAAGNVKRN